MIVLEILKIIGIVLLCILAFIIALLLLLLFWPFFYEIRLDNDDGLHGTITLSWLLKLVRFDVIYQSGLNLILRVLGIPFYDMQRKEKKKQGKQEKPKRQSRKKQEKTNGGDGPEILKAAAESKPSGDGAEDKEDAPAVSGLEAPESQPARYGAESPKGGASRHAMEDMEDGPAVSGTDGGMEPPPAKEQKKKEKGRWKRKYVAFWDKLILYFTQLPRKIEDLQEHLAEKIGSFLDTADYYQRLADKSGTRKVLTFLWKELKAILKHIRPYKSRIRIDSISDDPQKYAKIMEGYAFLYPYLPRGTQVASSYGEDNSFRFRMLLKGRFFLVFFAVHGCRILLNKKLKKFIKLVKREE